MTSLVNTAPLTILGLWHSLFSGLDALWLSCVLLQVWVLAGHDTYMAHTLLSVPQKQHQISLQYLAYYTSHLCIPPHNDITS